MFVGLQKTTLVNFPRRVAAAVFLPGCNMRCPYCNNAELAVGSAVNFTPKTDIDSYRQIEELYSFLEKRKGLINALVISGGEPCVSSKLHEIIRFAKSLNLEVKLDTNGTFPDELLEIVNSAELKPDMIALDVKTSIERYGELFPKMDETALKKITNAFLKTLKILDNIKEEIEIEYRTVLVPPLVSTPEITAIANLLPKSASWRLAQFVPGVCLNPEWNSVKPYSLSQAKELTQTAKAIVPDTELR